MTLRLLAALGCVAVTATLVACASFGDGEAAAVQTTDASANDAPATGGEDGGADASAPATDGGADPCGDRNRKAKFAARFDAPSEPWEFEQLVRVSDVGVEEFEVVTGAGLSGRALRVSAREGPTHSHNTWLRRGFGAPGAATRLRLDFDFIVEEAAHDYAIIGGLFFEAAGTVKDFGVAIRARGAQLDESFAGGLPIGAPFFDQNVVGTPHHAMVCVLRESATTNVRRIVRIDDTVVDDRGDLPLGDATGVEVRLGVFYTSWEGGETRVLYDDLEIRVD